MTTTNRGFLNPGGLAAALTCLVLAACGQPGSMDSGMMPMSDAGMPTGDGGMDTDAYVPPDHDAGMPDVDSGTDAGGDLCTAEMMATRVTPPCDPDNNGSGPGTAPSWFASHFGFGHAWSSPTSLSGCSTGTGVDSMGLPVVSISCPETDIEPCHSNFHYSADGTLNCNWQNRDLPGSQGDWQRIVLDADHMSGTLEVYDGGSSTPRITLSLWEG